jgi:hypothetical protein
MRGFATSPNPYFNGIKPRSFFAARLAMLRREQMMKKVDKNVYVRMEDEKRTKI